MDNPLTTEERLRRAFSPHNRQRLREQYAGDKHYEHLVRDLLDLIDAMEAREAEVERIAREKAAQIAESVEFPSDLPVRVKLAVVDHITRIVSAIRAAQKPITPTEDAMNQQNHTEIIPECPNCDAGQGDAGHGEVVKSDRGFRCFACGWRSWATAAYETKEGTR